MRIAWVLEDLGVAGGVRVVVESHKNLSIYGIKLFSICHFHPLFTD